MRSVSDDNDKFYEQAWDRCSEQMEKVADCYAPELVMTVLAMIAHQTVDRVPNITTEKKLALVDELADLVREGIIESDGPVQTVQPTPAKKRHELSQNAPCGA